LSVIKSGSPYSTVALYDGGSTVSGGWSGDGEPVAGGLVTGESEGEGLSAGAVASGEPVAVGSGSGVPVSGGAVTEGSGDESSDADELVAGAPPVSDMPGGVAGSVSFEPHAIVKAIVHASSKHKSFFRMN